jgi:UDP-glucose 4-epimerase
MKILITGSQGFLARNLAKTLNNKKFYVYGIGRGKWNKNEHKKWGYKKNVNNNISLKNIHKYKINFDYVIHCAGKVIGLLPEDDFQRNVSTTQSILEYISQKKIKPKLILMSTLAVYGNSKKQVLTENTKINPISNYAINKLLAEELCKFYNKKYNIDIMILRTGSLIGPGLKRQFIFDACNKIRKNINIFFGTGEEARDWLFIDDISILIFKIIKKRFKNLKIINVGSGRAIKIKDIISYISKKMDINISPKFNGVGKNSNPKILVSSIKEAKKFKWSPKIEFFDGLDLYIKWFLKK